MKNLLMHALAAPLLIATATARGQDANEGVQRPFAALNTFRSETLATQAKLKTQREQLTRDSKKIKQDQAAIEKLEKARDQARREAKTANLKVSPENKKWRCNAFGVLHDAPSQCSEPGKGGVWVSVDENGKTVRYMEPTQAELDRAKAADKKLAQAQLDLDIKKAQVRQAEETYKRAEQKLITESEELIKKVAILKQPEQYFKDLKGIYVSAALSTGKPPDEELLKRFDKMGETIGKSAGSGECVALVQKYAGLGRTGEWEKGKSVKDNPLVPLGVAATFIGEKDKYPSYPTGNHAVIVLDKTEKGLLVVDQFNKRDKDDKIEHVPARVSEIPSLGGIAKNQALIDKGEKEATEAGLKPTNEKGEQNRDYFKKKYHYYNPGHDADNYSYIQGPSPKKK